MIEQHIEKLRSDPRRLSRRALRTCAAEQPADIAEPTCSERRPAKQPRAEDAERDCYRKLALDAGKGCDRKRHNAAANLDRARKHNRVRCAKHLQQRVKKDNSNDAGDQCGHLSNIVASAAKSMMKRKAPWRWPDQFINVPPGPQADGHGPCDGGRRVDHPSLRPTEVSIFGNAKAGTPRRRVVSSV